MPSQRDKWLGQHRGRMVPGKWEQRDQVRAILMGIIGDPSALDILGRSTGVKRYRPFSSEAYPDLVDMLIEAFDPIVSPPTLATYPEIAQSLITALEPLIVNPTGTQEIQPSLAQSVIAAFNPVITVSGAGLWPDAFMSYTPQLTPIVLDGVDTQTIQNLSFEDFYRTGGASGGRPITLINCNNITIRRIDTRGCTMGLVYAYNSTNITIEYIRIENIAKEFAGWVGDWEEDRGPYSYFTNENDCNVYQLNGVNGFDITHLKARYGNFFDGLSHFASSNGIVDDVQVEGARTTDQITSDGQDSVIWTSDSGTGVIMGDGDGANVTVKNSSFLNCGQVGFATAGGSFCEYDNVVVYQQAAISPLQVYNTAGYVWGQYSVCSDHSVTNTRTYAEEGGEFWDGGNCGSIDVTGSIFGDGTLVPENYKVSL